MPNHLTWKGDLEPILMQRGVRLYQGRLGRWKDFAFFIPACSLRAAPGFALEECLRHVASDKPFAVFPVLPGLAAGDADWQEVGGILLYADSPQLLEAAVWEFRANGVLASDEFDDGEETSGYRWPDGQPWTLGDLAAEFCFMALCEITLYGATAPAGDCGSGAPVLDVVRSQDSIPTLRCFAPLRRSVEPNRFGAEEVRGLIEQLAGEGELLLQLSPESIADVWPRVRSARFYALRLRQGIIGEAADGQPVLAGGQEDPIIEWMWADTLEELYRLVRLGRIYECLALTGTISASAIWNR